MIKESDLKVGAYVIYRTKHKTEPGRIKSWNDKYVFMVYNCNQEWDRFQDYTGSATKREDLNFIG